MPQAATPPNAVDRSTRQLEQLVLDTALQGQDRLPAERQLALHLGISRSTLRSALARLAARGIIVARPGSGIFIRQDPAAQAPARPASWLQLLDEYPPLRADTMEFRLVFECASAGFAAQRATAAQRAELSEVLAAMRQALQAGDVTGEAVADARFHALIAIATHNTMLDRLHATTLSALRRHIEDNTYEASEPAPLAQERRQARLRQHEAIHAAICRQDAEAASQAMREHILYVGAQFAGG